MTAKRIGYVFGLVALVGSGSYLFIYLYRWEWNRALVAGLFFIAAEIAVATAAILERIRAVEKKLSAPERLPHATSVLRRVQESAPEPRDRFAWLSKESDLNVFVPLLLGAGVIASGIAWVVERIAGATAKPVLEQGLAARLQPIALPAGGLLTELPAPSPPVRNGGRSTVIRQLAALGIAVLAGTVGIDALSDATQTRPDRLVPGSSSTVVLRLELRDTNRTSSSAADALWGACSVTVSNRLVDRGSLGGDVFVFEVEPALGKHGERRLAGCLEDATLDNVTARILGTSKKGP